ncbi:AIP3-domain-containing protein [Backusella circina FSU 941]|nr:AIP3-domain-containing protein [Backusella circina FSU 941]
MRRASQTMTGEIEQTITHLLRTTKSLLESLNQWSMQRIPKTTIFEIHETLERQFFLVVQAFEELNVPMNDLQWIPGQMRELVTSAMTEIPSPETLDQHLPHIREVIVLLLQGLKAKQALLRESRVRSSDASWNNKEASFYLNRTSSSHIMPASPPLPPVTSPRLSNSSNHSNTEYDPWTGGMPRPTVPTNDLSSRIVQPPPPPPPPPKNEYMMPYSPPQVHSNHTSPSMSNIQLPTSIPSRENSINQNPYTQPMYAPTSPSEPHVYPPPTPHKFDENDPNTANALEALKRQENLARRSSVRRASMYRGDSAAVKQKYLDTGDSATPPPVPTLPMMIKKRNPSRLGPVSETEALNEEEKVEKEMTLFLQLGKQVKKITYNGEISLPALNMLFLEKFSYSSKQHDFPQIYIRDPQVGVSYELMDLTEIKSNSVLSLNIDEKEELKEIHKEILTELSQTLNKELLDTRRSFTEQLDQLKLQLTESVKATDDRFLTIKEVATLTDADGSNTVQRKNTLSKTQLDQHLNEIQTLRRDILTLKQLQGEMKEETNHVVNDIKQKASNLSEMKMTVNNTSSSSAARTQLEQGKTALLEKSNRITTRLEELQDTIDQLKLDVTQRKCQPSETQMTHCTNERLALSQEMKEFGEFMGTVKPNWKKTWEKELQTIVKEQQTLKDQEYLLSDMKEDLDALQEVFAQLETICAYQAKAKPVVREFRVAPVEEGFEGMSSVFKQVASIDVDHDRRLKALEQADKMRQRELANRIDDFEKELVNFVDTKKLKKTGGAMEIDRLRKQKEEDMLKQMFTSEKRPNETE